MSHEPSDTLRSAADTSGPSALVPVAAGPWAGWYHWEPVDDFEEHAGPFYCRKDEHGLVCAFMPEVRNRNSDGGIHGGALMTFADYALFMTAVVVEPALRGVTLTMNCEFIAAAQPGRLLTARTEIVRHGASIVFARGIIDDDGRPVLAFSGTIKKFKPRD